MAASKGHSGKASKIKSNAPKGSHDIHGVSGSWKNTGVSTPPSDPTVSSKTISGSTKIKPHKAMAMGKKGY